MVYSLVLSLFFYKSITWKEIPKILKESAEMTGIIIFLIGVSNIMSWIMAFTGIPTAISTALLGLTDNKYIILFIINILLLFVGTFMDMTPACLIFTPIVYGTGNAHDSFRYHADLQPLYRNDHTSGGNDLVCRSEGRKSQDRDSV